MDDKSYITAAYMFFTIYGFVLGLCLGILIMKIFG